MTSKLLLPLILLISLSSCTHILVRTAAPSPCSPTPRGCICVDKVIPYPECSTYLSYQPDDILPFLERYSK
jgi:hypothetical protein